MVVPVGELLSGRHDDWVLLEWEWLRQLQLHLQVHPAEAAAAACLQTGRYYLSTIGWLGFVLSAMATVILAGYAAVLALNVTPKEELKAPWR